MKTLFTTTFLALFISTGAQDYIKSDFSLGIESISMANMLFSPGGYRYYYGTFGSIGDYGFWWSATEGSATSAWDRVMDDDGSSVFRSNDDKDLGFSVRCVRD